MPATLAQMCETEYRQTPETRLVKQHVQTRETENQIVELKRTAEKKLNELAPEKRQRHL